MSGGQFGCPIVFRGNDGAGGQLGSTHSWCVEAALRQRAGASRSRFRPYAGRRQGAAQGRHPRRRTRLLPRVGASARPLKGEVPEDEYTIPLRAGGGRSAAPGRDCTIVSFGRPVHFCLEAADEAGEGGHRLRGHRRAHDPAARSSTRSFESVRKTNYCVVVDQSWPFASPASARSRAQVHRALLRRSWTTTSHRVNSDDVPAPYAYNLEQEMLPNARKICEAVRASVTYNAFPLKAAHAPRRKPQSHRNPRLTCPSRSPCRVCPTRWRPAPIIKWSVERGRRRLGRRRPRRHRDRQGDDGDAGL